MAKEFSESTIEAFFNSLPNDLKRIFTHGRSVQVIADFDETLCSQYVFSNTWNTHVPILRKDLVVEAQKLTMPLCIATARGALEETAWVIWHRLSRSPMPLVAENGAALVWPGETMREHPTVEILASGDQKKLLDSIHEALLQSLQTLQVPDGHEILLRKHRVATIELRAQDAVSKKGTPEDYASLTEQLQEMFPGMESLIDLVPSGSSLGLVPVGIDKSIGINEALARASIDLSQIFPIGIGDNHNDAPLFDFVLYNGGLSFGVRPEAHSHAAFAFNGGDSISLQLLQAINKMEEIV